MAIAAVDTAQIQQVAQLHFLALAVVEEKMPVIAKAELVVLQPVAAVLDIMLMLCIMAVMAATALCAYIIK